jgi:hypothetical protein
MIRSKNNTRHFHQTICSRGTIVLKYCHITACWPWGTVTPTYFAANKSITH